MSYNGHVNWTHWNISLWLHNDEGLYNLMLESINNNRTKDDAAETMLDTLQGLTNGKTPDGAKYSKTGIRAAMAG